MRAMNGKMRMGLWALVALGVGSTATCGEMVLEEKRGPIVAKATIDRETVELSDAIRVVLTVEGPAPLEVAPPRPLLTRTSAGAWRVREMGLPTRQALDKGRQLWKQEFELAPFDKGSRVAVEFEPLRVKAGNQAESTISWSKSAGVQVTTQVKEVDVSSLVPVTPIEQLPPPPPPFTPRPKPGMLVGLAISIALIIGALLLIVLRRKKPEEPRLTGAARALHDLARIRVQATGSPPDFERIADVVRLYLEERFQIPALRLTTAEVIAAAQKEVAVLAPFRSQVETILERCDLAKFASLGPERNDCAECIGQAVAFVEQSSALQIASAPIAESA